MHSILADLQYGARILLKNPGFTAIAIVALALGIGANAAIFSAVDAVLLRPLPYGHPESLVFVWEDSSYLGFPRNTPAPANYVDWKKQNQVFSDMAASRGRTVNLAGNGTPETILGHAVTANYFSVLDVKPILGRIFTEDEDRTGAGVILISYGLWQRRFGGDASLVGDPILVNDQKRTVLGVMPRGFTTPGMPADFWIPTHFAPADLAARQSHFLNVVARLKPGVTLESARADMQTIAARLQREYPKSNTGVGAVVVPVVEQVIGDTRTALLVLLAAAGCVLLIACANIANLLLARAAGRNHEMAIRTALGAGRLRLLRQMVTESVLLSVSGGALGLVLAPWGMRVLQQLVPAGLSGSATLAVDARLLLFTLAVAVGTGVAFGIVPAIQSTEAGLEQTLKQSGRTGTGLRQKSIRDLLVVAEMALALVLLIGAGLMIQTLARLRSIDPGFRPDHLLTMTTRHRYADPIRRFGYFEMVLERVKALPGIQNAAFVSNLPFNSRGNTNGFRIEGRPEPPHANIQDAMYRVCTNDYLKMIGVRLKEGRLLGDEDRADSLPVVVINETFARTFWPDRSPLGARLRLDGEAWLTIVGVVADVRERGLESGAKPGVYVPVCQNPNAWAIPEDLGIRTAVDPLSLVSAVRTAIWSVDPEQPIFRIRSMDETLDLEVAGRNQDMVLLTAFAGLALLLASIGIYGVLSYAVAQRKREMGLRMALGADARNVTRMVMSQGMRLAGLGLAIGTVAALALTRLMVNLLYGVSAADPATFIGVIVLLFVVALLACYVPAARAARMDPIQALREE
jgi:putative ABC transport system permease protein